MRKLYSKFFTNSLLTTFFCFGLANCTIKSNFLINLPKHIKDRPLMWNDFKAPPDTSSTYHAMISTGLHYNFSVMRMRKDTVVIQFTCWPVMYPRKSWVKLEKGIDTANLLKHEQGHYDIAHWYSKELKQRFYAMDYSPDRYNLEIDSILQTVKTELRSCNKLYDSTTNHGLNRAIQEDWYQRIDSALNSYN